MQYRVCAPQTSTLFDSSSTTIFYFLHAFLLENFTYIFCVCVIKMTSNLFKISVEIIKAIRFLNEGFILFFKLITSK